MNEIASKAWEFTFFEKDNKYYLSVMCGSIGVYELIVELVEEEMREYRNKGISFIESLAQKIQYSPSAYADRNTLK